MNRWLAHQFARPEGRVGEWLVGPLIDWIGRPMMTAAADALDVCPGDRVLDLGFGGGALSAAILDAGGRVMGVDRSPAMGRRARRRFAPAVASGRAGFLEGMAEALPLDAGSADKAASVNTLYFWPDLRPPLAELARVLVPAGRLVLGWQTEEAVRAWPGHVHGFTAWPDAAVVAAVEASGFAVKSVTPGHARRLGDYRTLVALRGPDGRDI